MRKVILPLLLFAILPGQSQTAQSQEYHCPKSEAEFYDQFKKVIYDLPNPNQITSVNNWAHYCQSNFTTEPESNIQDCLKPLSTLMKTLNAEENGVGITKRKERAYYPLVIPKIFSDSTITNAIGKKQDQKALDLSLAKLSQALPPEAKVFQFQSSTIQRRSVVAVLPGAKEDIYMHSHEGFDGDYLSIRINKIDRNGNKISPPTIDFFNVDAKTLQPTPRFGRCIACHRTGTLATIDENGVLVSHTKGMSNQEMQKWWNSFRTTSIDISNIDFGVLGPQIGPTERSTRTDEFMKACASREGLNSEQALKIKNRMNCAECHENVREESLMYPMQVEGFPSDLLDNRILHGHMPEKADDPTSSKYLPPELRKGLLTCLKAEFFGGFKDDGISKGNKSPGILMEYLVPPSCHVQQKSKSQSTQSKSTDH